MLGALDEGPATTSELAARLGLSRHVWRVLARLEAEELVEHEGSLWRLTPDGDLELAAALAGTDGTGVAQHHRHEAERRALERGRRRKLHVAGMVPPKGEAGPRPSVPVPIPIPMPALRQVLSAPADPQREELAEPAEPALLGDVLTGLMRQTGGGEDGLPWGQEQREPRREVAVTGMAGRAEERARVEIRPEVGGAAALHERVASLAQAAGWPRIELSDGLVVKQGPIGWAKLHLARRDQLEAAEQVLRGGAAAATDPPSDQVASGPGRIPVHSGGSADSRVPAPPVSPGTSSLNERVIALAEAAGWPGIRLSGGRVVKEGPMAWAGFQLARRAELEEAEARLGGGEGSGQPTTPPTKGATNQQANNGWGNQHTSQRWCDGG